MNCEIIRGSGRARTLLRCVAMFAVLIGVAGVPPTTAGAWIYADSTPGVDDLPLNQVQMVGTHNSYHVATTASPTRADTKAPFGEQFDFQGVRHIELDVYTWGGEFRVMHTPVIDAGSQCVTLSKCLDAIARWSDSHPGHDPIMVFLDLKYDKIFNFFLPLTAGDIDRLSAVTVQALGGSRLVTGSELRAGRASIEQRVAEVGWPRVGELRGRVMAVVIDDNFAAKLAPGADVGGDVLLGGAERSENWGGDVMFAQVADPSDQKGISRALQRGMLVRTFADEDLVQVRANNGGRADRAFASGAQLIATDQPADRRPEAPHSLPGGYGVVTPSGAPLVCDRVTRPGAGCPA